MKKFKKILFLFLGFLIFSNAEAAGLFTVVPTDMSMNYLGTIFGGSVGAVTLGGGANPLLSNMFEKFNFIIVTFGVAVLSYIGIAAAINTAREGQAMGQKMSLWVPLRAALGMLFMIPSPGTGYSVVQMTVMWFVLSGIGAANAVWNVVLDQMAQGVQAVGAIAFPATLPDSTISTTLVGSVMLSATCMASLNSMQNLDMTQNYGQVAVNTVYGPILGPAGSPATISQQAIVNVGITGNNAPANLINICGTYTVNSSIVQGDPYNAFNESSLNQRVQIKVNAITTMLSDVAPAAEDFAVTTTQGGVAPQPPAPGYVELAVSAFKTQMINLAVGVQSPLPTSGTALSWEQNPVPPSTTGSATISTLREIGWIHAGGYYFMMVNSPSNNPTSDICLPNTNNIPTPVSNSPGNYNITINSSGTTIPTPGWPNALTSQLANAANMSSFNMALGAAQTYWNSGILAPTPTLPGMGSASVPPIGTGILDALAGSLANQVRAPIINMFTTAIGGGTGDPLLAMMIFGTQIIQSAELSVILMLGVTFVSMIAGSSMQSCNPFPATFSTLFMQMFVFGTAVIIVFWTAGATLGIYLPLVPYLIFTTTAVGWFMAVIEALVGAPIIALSLVTPGGEELGNIKPALNILANLFLRPTLMIFGFVIAGSLLKATINMINFGFETSVTMIPPTLSGIIPILGVYCMLVTGMVNQSFSLIYELPNKVLRYMGGQAESFTPDKLMGEAKGGFDKGAAASEGGLKKAHGAAGAGASKAVGGGFTKGARAERDKEFMKSQGKTDGGGDGG
jgi:defect in organelle trafficking protein DotA